MFWLSILTGCAPTEPEADAGGGSRVEPAAWRPLAPAARRPLAQATGGPASRCAAEDVACVDVATVPPLWTTAAGFVLGGVELAGDVNGDGYVDAEASFGNEAGETHTSIVFGPLRRSLVLPDDEDVGIVGTCFDVLEVTGDGVLDFVCDNPREVFGEARLPDVVIPGPLEGTIDLATDPRVVELGAVADRYLDWDGDGRVDLHANLHDGTGVVGKTWTGEWTTWGHVPPDVSLTWSCASDPDDVDPTAARTDDMDGDGVDELWLGGSLRAEDDCSGFGLPATATGLIDVPTSPLRIAGEPGLWMGDMDGDGRGEWRFRGTSGDPDRYLTGPVAFVDGEPVGAGEVFVHASLTTVGAIFVDLDGDGVGELGSGTMDELHVATSWIFTGGAGGGATTATPMFTVHSDGANPGVSAWFVEDGAAVGFAPTDVRVQPAGVRFVTAVESGAVALSSFE